ncbi:ArsR/SmtB family transcription factor [Luteococcus japonicus]|uniref:ArsR/SmtB family transcription factor n=1 Tax=Luteococcus japonicus TaxID=33984 RepID=UPI000B9A1E53|nr:metalloregulator ArsR/SmtB family transcription factor [Luteococcus japonicus]
MFSNPGQKADALHTCAPGGNPDRIAALTRTLPPESTVEELASVFGLLGDPGRVRLLITLLEGGEVCVHDLAAVTGQSESGVSHALRLLRAHRVVVVRRSGRLAFYRLADGHVRLLLDVALTHLGHAPAPRAVRTDEPSSAAAEIREALA